MQPQPPVEPVLPVPLPQPPIPLPPAQPQPQGQQGHHLRQGQPKRLLKNPPPQGLQGLQVFQQVLHINVSSSCVFEEKPHIALYARSRGYVRHAETTDGGHTFPYVRRPLWIFQPKFYLREAFMRSLRSAMSRIFLEQSYRHSWRISSVSMCCFSISLTA